MVIFHMQLHPNDPQNGIAHARRALENNPPVIGLDFDEPPDSVPFVVDNPQQIESFIQAYFQAHNEYGPAINLRDFLRLTNGDVGLVRSGGIPIALVRVTGPYYYQADASIENPPWFRHRFPVEILGYYEQDLNNHLALVINPPAQGTFQMLIDPNGATYRAIKDWCHNISTSKSLRMTSQLLDQRKQIIFTGPPGTGKTREAKRLAYFMLHEQIPPADFENTLALLQNNPNQQVGAWDIVQFHPSFNYDDFVRGIRVQTDNDGHTRYTTEDGPLLKLAQRAKNCTDQKFILIIDEINRANVAAVLGEFIYALEYRGESVALQYAREENDRISIPENLYIIGTMNSADRSIGHLDYAVRRRFAFVDLLPDIGAIRAYQNIENNNVKESALQKYEMVRNLFEGDQSKLTGDYQAHDVQPGHSYFLVNTIHELNLNMKYQIAPLLREYIADGVLKPSANQQIDEIAQPIGERP